MSSNILDRNLLSLSGSSQEAAGLITYAAGSDNLEFRKSRTGKTIPVYSGKNGEQKILHSSFDPDKEGIRLASQYKPEGALIIFGLGGGYHIRPFLEKTDISTVIIIENSPEEVRTILSEMDLSDIFLDSRVSLWISGNPEEFRDYFLSRYVPVISGDLQTLLLRPRVLLDEPFFNSVADVLKDTLSRITDDYTVQTHFGKKWFINTLINLRESENTTLTLSPIRKALVTAAGPSLEKQIDILKENRGGATLIATDTSLPVLLRRGIIPDLIISIDCQHISYHHFLQGYPEEVPLILDLASPPLLTRLAKKKFFFTSDHPFSRYVSRYFRQFPRIDTSGGNVTHAAVSLADSLGASEIQLYGADFSYPSGKPYARDTYIYPYFYSRSMRTGGIENQFFSFILHNKSIIKEKTASGYRYISKPMIHYKASLEREAGQCRARIVCIPGDGVKLNIPENNEKWLPEFRILGAGENLCTTDEFLKEYRRLIESLPEVRSPVSSYMESLQIPEKEIWTTLLPAAAQFRKGTDSGLEAISKAKEWTLDILRRSCSG